MSRLLIPNTAQVPNVLLDQIMPKIKNTSLRVALAVVRFTYGFQKKADKISLTQLQRITGLSRQGVVNGVAALGPLLKIKPGAEGRGANEYSLNLDVSTGQLVNHFDQSTILTSQNHGSEVVNAVDSPKPIRSKPNKTGAKAPDLSLFGLKEETDPKRESDKQIPQSTLKKRSLKPTRRGAPGIPPELQLAVSKIIGRINELAGTNYHDDKPGALKCLLARLHAGAAEADCLAVVEHQWGKWGHNVEMIENFNPVTLFREENFERYLVNAKRSGSNGHSDGPPAFKDLGNGIVEADGLKMSRKDYDRKYGPRAS